jgi:glycosyltransferase involved in cell wall biosynthesis
MRFCMVTTFYPPHHFGGDAIFVHRLSHALANRDHEVEVLYNADAWELLSQGPPWGDLPHHPRVRVRALRSRLGPAELLAMQQTGRAFLHRKTLRSVLEGGRFDVIHFHNVSLAGGPGVLALGGATKLYTVHDHWLVCPMHVLWRYGREPCAERTCIRCQLRGRRPPQAWRKTGLLARMLQEVDLFLAPSLFTLQKHRELGLSLPMRHLPHFVPTPPDADPPGHREARPGEREFFLFAGRLEPEKGVDTLLRAFHRYRAADLLIAGDGRERPRLEREARDSPHVRFLGPLPPGRVADHARRAVAALVPSAGYEVFGLTAVEAFAAGTPAIVRKLGSLPELIEVSGGGLLFENEEDLIESMERLRADPALRERLGEKARAAHRRHWSEEVHLRAYTDLIREADAVRRRRRS